MNMHWVSLLLRLSTISAVAALSLLSQPKTRYRLQVQVRSIHSSLSSSARSCSLTDRGDETEQTTTTTSPSTFDVPILPARQPLPSFFGEHDECFSLLSWNILLPNSIDNWWCHKQYAHAGGIGIDIDIDNDKAHTQWKHRQSLIKERVLHSAPDVFCMQEADGDTFDADFEFMKDAGYDHVLHKKFRFRCATFFLKDKFLLEQVAHKDRTLVTSLRCRTTPTSTQRILHVVNCHLSGGAAPERRLRQVHDAVDQIRKWTNVLERTVTQLSKGKRPSPKLVAKAEQALAEYQDAAMIVCGDFNSDGNTAVRKLLVEGSVEPDWHEPQYPDLRLTSKRREQLFGNFIDAAELAYGGNVCDGDYGEAHTLSDGSRPATYVVPNFASLLLLPISKEEDIDTPQTQFGLQIARGLADALNLNEFCDMEMNRAFKLADHDGNGSIDRDEVLTLLENAYVATYGQQIEQERRNFFWGFDNKDQGDGGLTKEQFTNRLKALQQDCEGERKAFGLAKGFNLQKLSEMEMEQAFEDLDLDGNGLLDEDEFQTLLETVYVAIYGEEIDKQRTEFFMGFQNTGSDASDSNELTRVQFTERLLALHQELEGGRKGALLTEVRTEADVQKMIERFTPLLQRTLDEVFDKYSSNGDTLTQEDVNNFLIKTNGELGRGGTFRHTSTIFKQIESSSKPAELTRRDWYGVFARELAEGRGVQVVYDLEECGSNVRSHHPDNSRDKFYQGWLDYIYFQKLVCTGVQDVLTEAERARIYSEGDALPNEWHPSDHLPVSAIFSWK
uniref:EF-hand domain-containing protein n=1 Tax=Chaetoceros debilis TaxID=122233 RepID=A0A7S3QA10_9STRA